MTALLLRRLGRCLAILFFAGSLAFLIVHLAPGDPARAIVGPHANEETLAHARAWHGLDRSLPEQYLRYLSKLASGDLGQSYRSHRPVADIILEKGWPTLQLALAALLLQLSLGIPLGVAAVRRSGRWRDRTIVAAAVVTLSVPTFVTGVILLYALGFYLGWLPLNGYGETFGERIAHLILPALTITLTNIAATVLLLRSELGRILDEEYIRAARAKGVGERAILWRHALRPSLVPVLAVLSVDFGVQLTSAVVAESIFGWPGLGRESMMALIELDIPLVMGVVMVTAAFISLTAFLVDVAVMLVDPRARPRAGHEL